MYLIAETTILILYLVFLSYVCLKKQHETQLNWSMFYSCLYILIFLPIVNAICEKLGYWSFNEDSFLLMPIDVYFIWIISWSILPVYIFKGKHIIIIGLSLLLIDLSLMPIIEKQGLFTLNDNWIIGEILTLIFVFLPSYYWAKSSYYNNNTGHRSLFQIMIMACMFLLILPLLMKHYNWINYVNFNWSTFEIQLFFIVVFPALTAVTNFVKICKGTPFPYDPTRRLVQSGVYAYCKNPIQWSFSFMFILLSFYHSNFIFLLGCLFSIAYSLSISDFQEYSDMENRFGVKWIIYKNTVPKWYFQWKPKAIPNGKIYFDANCNQCNELKAWFKKRKPINLSLLNANDFKEYEFKQVTYIDEFGDHHKSLSAIAYALNHTNLAYASLGWLIQFPIINDLLQVIIDALGLFKTNIIICDIKKPS